MPVDATIIPQKQNVPDFSAPMNILSLLQQTQGQQLQNQIAQQGLSANKAASMALQGNIGDDGNFNMPNLLKALSANPDAAYNLPETLGKVGQAQSALYEAQNKKIENAQKQMSSLVPIASDWIAKGDKITHDDIRKGFSKAIASGTVTPEMAMTHFGDVPKDPKELKSWVDKEVKHLSDAQTALSMITGTFNANVGGNQPGFVNAFNQTVTPAKYVGNPANLAPEVPKEVPKETPVAELKLRYPVRAAGDISPQLPEEAADREAGQTYVTSLLNAKSNMADLRRNLNEVLDKASFLAKDTPSVKWTGAWSKLPGDMLNQAIRNAHNWAHDPEYIQLSKDLANVQLASMTAQGGGDTDAARSLRAAANGKEVYPPEILADIASRAKSSLRNVDLQGTAADKFAKKYGYNNMKSFQELWGNHADTKLFEMMDLHDNPNMSAKEKTEKRDKLMGITSSMTPAEKKARQAEFVKKNAVLEKLVNTGGI